KPESYHDEFREKLEKVVEEKVKAGKGEPIVKPIEGEEMEASADIIDLTELLRRSLRKGTGKSAANDEDAKPARRERHDHANRFDRIRQRDRIRRVAAGNCDCARYERSIDHISR
ncbi:MAG: hypothetical protein V4637_14840, partial [Pseudomonadota bacterium]